MKNFKQWSVERLNESQVKDFPPELLKNLAFLFDKLATHYSHQADKNDYYWRFKYKVKRKLESNPIDSLNNLIGLLSDEDWYQFKQTKITWDNLDKENIDHIIQWYNNSLLPSIRHKTGMYVIKKTVHNNKDEPANFPYKGHQTWRRPTD